MLARRPELRAWGFRNPASCDRCRCMTKAARSERGLFGTLVILVGGGCLLVALLGVFNTAFELKLALSVSGTNTPLPDSYDVVAGVAAAGVLLITLFTARLGTEQQAHHPALVVAHDPVLAAPDGEGRHRVDARVGEESQRIRAAQHERVPAGRNTRSKAPSMYGTHRCPRGASPSSTDASTHAPPSAQPNAERVAEQVASQLQVLLPQVLHFLEPKRAAD